MPKRLIHLQDDNHAALVEAVNGSEHANATYAALSYCWAGDQKFKAKRSNLSLLMEQGFLIASLPIVWRETIELCRKLGLQYLWIDALCIVQDDEADWVEELARMGTIYENAYLIIASASSGSVETPYLGSTPDPSRQPVESTVLPATPSCPATTVCARKFFVNWHVNNTYEMNKDPWRLRGWTMQEEMQWRCKTALSCECQENIVYGNWPKEFCERDGNISRETRKDEWCKFWRYSVVGRFGPRQLTHPEDILSALSGIAQRFAGATSWTYVSGMWKENLIFEMCWHNTFVEGVDPVYRVYTAPTFSWASVNGTRVIHPWLHEKSFTPDAEVVDVNIEPKYAGAPFATLVDGCLILRGRLAQASLEYADGKYNIVLDSNTQGDDGTTCREELQFHPDTHIQAVPAATSSPEGHQEKLLWTGPRASKYYILSNLPTSTDLYFFKVYEPE